MASSTRVPARKSSGAEEAASRAQALTDSSARGQRLSGLADLARDGPAATAQRHTLQAAFGVAQLGGKGGGKSGGKGGGKGGGKDGGKGGSSISKTDFDRHYWIYLLQVFLAHLQAEYPKNTNQPASNDVGRKDALMHPPESGVEGSDHHTDTSGGGKKGRKVSSSQLMSDVQQKIGEILGYLSLKDVPDHCKDKTSWDTWRKDHDPSGGGGGLTA